MSITVLNVPTYQVAELAWSIIDKDSSVSNKSIKCDEIRPLFLSERLWAVDLRLRVAVQIDPVKKGYICTVFDVDKIEEKDDGTLIHWKKHTSSSSVTEQPIKSIGRAVEIATELVNAWL